MATKIIFDTDIGCDCDDAAALALALELMNAGECELLAVTHCTMNESRAVSRRFWSITGIPKFRWGHSGMGTVSDPANGMMYTPRMWRFDGTPVIKEERPMKIR